MFLLRKMSMGYYTQKKHLANLNRGITLVELIIVIGILGGVVGLVASFQSGVFKMNRLFGNGIDVSFEGNRVVKDLAQTIRPLTQSARGAFPVEIAATSTFAFFSDVDRDGVAERVRYYLASTTLKKGVTEPTGNPAVYNPVNEVSIELAHYVRNSATTSIFSYYDRNYMGTTTPLTYPITMSAVRHVRVLLILDKDNDSPPPFTVTTGVTFRNLKDNQ